MKKEQIMNMTKKMAIGFLAATTILSGISVLPMTADAAAYGTGGYEDKIIYDGSYSIKEYWTADSATRKAPKKDGYVFGGWYADDQGATPLKETEAAEEVAKETPTAYAKFVPAYVLSVKAQNSQGVEEGHTDPANIRLVSSVDCENYAKVGFDVILANKVDVATATNTVLETTTVYSKLQAGETMYDDASKVFGSLSKKFSVWRLDGFANTKDSIIVNVTPYWITLDGTKAEGVGKYLHIEDGYKKYISVPVYLQSDGILAAGALQMTYPSDILTVKDVEFCNQEGALLEKAELTYRDDGAGTIQFVANAATLNKSFATDGIYANVRFTVSGSYSGVGTGTFLDFTVSGESFCDWDEKDVTESVSAWDIQY